MFYRGLAAVAAAFVASAPAMATVHSFTFDNAHPRQVNAGRADFITPLPAFVLNAGDVVDLHISFDAPVAVRAHEIASIYAEFQGGLVTPGPHDASEFVSSSTYQLFGNLGALATTGTVSGPPNDPNVGPVTFALYLPVNNAPDLTLSGFNVQFSYLSGPALNINNLFADVEGVVPEPATWAMMLLGFGAMGAAARRRPVRQRQGTAA